MRRKRVTSLQLPLLLTHLLEEVDRKTCRMSYPERPIRKAVARMLDAVQSRQSLVTEPGGSLSTFARTALEGCQRPLHAQMSPKPGGFWRLFGEPLDGSL
eukprot:205475-Amphidinium_carterae.1